MDLTFLWFCWYVMHVLLNVADAADGYTNVKWSSKESDGAQFVPDWLAHSAASSSINRINCHSGSSSSSRSSNSAGVSQLRRSPAEAEMHKESAPTRKISNSERPPCLPHTAASIAATKEDVNGMQNERGSEKRAEELATTHRESDEPKGEIDEVIRSGFRALNELVEQTEPELYKLGLYLESKHPGKQLALFGAANKRSLEVSHFGFAALHMSKALSTKYLQRGPQQQQPQERGGPTTRVRARLLDRGCPFRRAPRCPENTRHQRTSDGSCNHPRPWRGTANTPLLRFLPPVYDDGVQAIRRSVTGQELPSARLVSTTIHSDESHLNNRVTALFTEFGQFIAHDLVLVPKSQAFNGSTPRCCRSSPPPSSSTTVPPPQHPHCLPITVPRCDHIHRAPLRINCLEFVRSAPSTRLDCDPGYREQINQVTSFLDASTIYGSDAFTAEEVRSPRRGGRLVFDGRPGGVCAAGAISTTCFEGGDTRFGEHAALTSLHTLFVRYHNHIANRLANDVHPHWSDERLFQQTRKIVIAAWQHIVFNEYLPVLLGDEVVELFGLKLLSHGYYMAYNQSIDPTISNSFGTAAFRFGHSMVPHSFRRADSNHRFEPDSISTHNDFEDLRPLSLDRLVMGMCNQPAENRDPFISRELTHHLFQSSDSGPNGFGTDLAAINIQRGRDHGLPPYVAWRQPCRLSRIDNWSHLEGVVGAKMTMKLRSIYAHVDDIDLFTGGLVERPVRDAIVGPTFACIIAQQFSNLRKADRFWYENRDQFSAPQLRQIRSITLAHILCATLDEMRTVQPFPLQGAGLRGRVNCRQINTFDMGVWAAEENNQPLSKIEPRPTTLINDTDDVRQKPENDENMTGNEDTSITTLAHISDVFRNLFSFGHLNLTDNTGYDTDQHDVNIDDFNHDTHKYFNLTTEEVYLNSYYTTDETTQTETLTVQEFSTELPRPMDLKYLTEII